MMYRNSTVAATEMSEPTELTVFQPSKASG